MQCCSWFSSDVNCQGLWFLQSLASAPTVLVITSVRLISIYLRQTHRLTLLHQATLNSCKGCQVHALQAELQTEQQCAMNLFTLSCIKIMLIYLTPQCEDFRLLCQAKKKFPHPFFHALFPSLALVSDWELGWHTRLHQGEKNEPGNQISLKLILYFDRSYHTDRNSRETAREREREREREIGSVLQPKAACGCRAVLDAFGNVVKQRYWSRSCCSPWHKLGTKVDQTSSWHILKDGFDLLNSFILKNNGDHFLLPTNYMCYCQILHMHTLKWFS